MCEFLQFLCYFEEKIWICLFLARKFKLVILEVLMKSPIFRKKIHFCPSVRCSSLRSPKMFQFTKLRAKRATFFQIILFQCWGKIKILLENKYCRMRPFWNIFKHCVVVSRSSYELMLGLLVVVAKIYIDGENEIQ